MSKFTQEQLGQQLASMLALVSTKFEKIHDKQGMPYVLHLLRVMGYLNTTDMELMMIGLGHDLVEDIKGFTYAELRRLIPNERVIEGIRCMTKELGESYEEYQEKVLSNIDSIRVKMADIKDNSDIHRLKGISESDLARITRYQLFYTRLKDRLIELTEEANLRLHQPTGNAA